MSYANTFLTGHVGGFLMLNEWMLQPNVKVGMLYQVDSVDVVDPNKKMAW